MSMLLKFLIKEIYTVDGKKESGKKLLNGYIEREYKRYIWSHKVYKTQILEIKTVPEK